ncbi:hypothetical protein J6590_052220 [Homalodisca vitripennis]|nr:hypothetical protein J6590_052220 [Homalodisca vitripennis]
MASLLYLREPLPNCQIWMVLPEVTPSCEITVIDIPDKHYIIATLRLSSPLQVRTNRNVSNRDEAVPRKIDDCFVSQLVQEYRHYEMNQLTTVDVNVNRVLAGSQLASPRRRSCCYF